VKRTARAVIEKYYSRLTLDFHTNKKVTGEVAILPSKRMRNKIAGFITHLMKRIQRGPVRGISLKLQEEERERKLDFVPEVRIGFIYCNVMLCLYNLSFFLFSFLFIIHFLCVI
jgi:small subunit ribosomal protein S17e